MNTILFDEKGKTIVKLFDELMPWDKGEILKHISDHCMTDDEVERYFIEGLGYVKYNDIDNVKEVIDNDLEDEVLDEMDDWDICDYLISSYRKSGADNLSYILERLYKDDAADGISKTRDSDLEDIFNSLYNRDKDKFNTIKEIINCIEKSQENEKS